MAETEVGTLASNASKWTAILNGLTLVVTVPLVVDTKLLNASPHNRSWHTVLPLWIAFPLSEAHGIVSQSELHEVAPTFGNFFFKLTLKS